MKRIKFTPVQGTSTGMKNLTKHRRGGRRGSTLVEFALILPILLTISMVMVQYGIILNAMISLTNLTREGARYAAIHPPTNSTTLAAIQDNMESKLPPGITLTDSDIQATCNPTTCTPSSDVTVTVTYNMRRKMFLPTTFFKVKVFGSGTYTGKATMRVE